MSPTPTSVALVLEALAYPEVQDAVRRLLGDNTAPASTRVAYTVKQLADEVGMTPRGIRAAIDRGDLRGIKTGGRWLVSADAVRAWASAGEDACPPGARRSPRVRPVRRASGLAAAFAAIEVSNS